MSIEQITYKDTYDELSEVLLDIKSKNNKSRVRKYVYCESCRTKRDVSNKLYVSFKFRDRFGRHIDGRQFDIESIKSIVEVLPKINKNLVEIEFELDYFKGYYLNVSKVSVVPDTISEKYKKQFFSVKIDGFEDELQQLDKAIELLAKGNLKEVCEQFNVVRKLSESYSYLEEGRKGSSLKVANALVGLCATSFDKLRGQKLAIASILIESICCDSDEDIEKILNQVSMLRQLIALKIDGYSKEVFDIVESAIYLKYNLHKDLYFSDGMLAKTIRETIIQTMQVEDVIKSSTSIFEYNGYLLEKRF